MSRAITRWLLAIAYLAAGIVHIAQPVPFLSIMPRFVPLPDQVVFWTGIAEVLGAIALAQGTSLRLRRAAGVSLALYALCVWPANVQHMINDLARADNGLGLVYHVPRMIAQPIIVWAALWTGRVIDWPFGRAGQSAASPSSPSSRSTKSSSSEPL